MTICNDIKANPRIAWDIRGDSSETKPTDATNGSTFYEIDTGDLYMYSEKARSWVKQ